MGNLVDHAKRELAIIGEEPEFIKGYLKVVKAFEKMGHSGGSASVAIPVINALLQYQNLTPLTDDPDEWFYHDEVVWGAAGGIWQNKRNGEAFSPDGGKTYYLLSENGNAETYANGSAHLHKSYDHTKLRRVQEARDS